MAESACLFLSGMGRSGTTLLDKLLAGHRSLSVLSQPFPFLFLQAKRDFLKTLGDDNPSQPLSHYFLDNRYGPRDLAGFLKEYRLSPTDVRQLFDAMADYDGQYHKPPDLAVRLDAVPGGSFLETYCQLVAQLAVRSPAAWYGAKETHCEEFFPFFVGQGVKCLAIVRDPRDVITSFHFGQGHRFAGLRRPTLFYVRNWRKSVMFLMLLESHPGFHWLRYEDLVERPEETLNGIARFLGIDPFPDAVSRSTLRQQDGQLWAGNSSHEPSSVMNERSVGRYREWMPEQMRRYVECACLPELRWLNYPGAAVEDDVPRLLAEYREPFSIERPDFASDYSSSPAHVQQELHRLSLLREHRREDSEGYFLTAGIRERLSRALAGEDTARRKRAE